MENSGDHVSERDFCPVIDGRKRETKLRAAVESYRRARGGREFAFAGAVIRLDMGPNDRLDAHAVALGDFNVFSDLELRIDDRGAALSSSTENVRRAARFCAQQLSKDHCGNSLVRG
jgi:hypothetical protein